MPSLEPLLPFTRDYIDRLKNCGITSTDFLVYRCRQQESRRIVAAMSGIPEDALLRLALCAELTRLRSVGMNRLELFYRAGITSLHSLAHADPGELLFRMDLILEQQQAKSRLPSIRKVRAWIAEATKMDSFLG